MGDKVYLDYTQDELDRAYDQRVWASNADEILRRCEAASVAARAGLFHRSGVAYGPGADELLDIFAAARENAPIHVHIHGGSWRHLTKDNQSYLAPAFVAAGAVSIMLNFSVIPNVRIPEMVAQIRRAIAWIYHNAESFGGNKNQIHLTGDSSGAHLGGVMATTDWPDFGLPADVITSASLLSGMYDLRPVMLSARRNFVTLTPEEVEDFSALLHLDRLRTRILIAYGTRESPEFLRQSKEFFAAAKAAGVRIRAIEIPGANHYEMHELLGEPGGMLVGAVLETMEIG